MILSRNWSCRVKMILLIGTFHSCDSTCFIVSPKRCSTLFGCVGVFRRTKKHFAPLLHDTFETMYWKRPIAKGTKTFDCLCVRYT